MSLAAASAKLRLRFRRWAIRNRVPEASPIHLAQRRVYVLPTRAGLALLVTLLVIFLASINYNLSLGYALVFLLGSILVAHILFAWRTLVNLKLSFQAGDENYAGSLARWQLTLHNAQRHERPAIRLLDGDEQLLLQTDVPPHGDQLEAFALPAPQRGLQQAGTLKLETRQPLGWIRAWAYVEPDAPALIYPEPGGDLPLPSHGHAESEGQAGELPGQDDFAGLRSFQPGDSPRQIAWKQLAQGRGLLSKQYSGLQSPDCVLDWAALPASLSPEERLSQLTTWLLQARQAGLPCRLRLPDGETGPGTEPAHYHACLQRLALFPDGFKS